jgi:hypothetical protein
VEVFVVAAEADSGVVEQDLVDRAGQGVTDRIGHVGVGCQSRQDHVGRSKAFGVQHPHQLRELPTTPTTGVAKRCHHSPAGLLGAAPVQLLNLDLVKLEHPAIGTCSTDVIGDDLDHPGAIRSLQALGQSCGDPLRHHVERSAPQLSGQEPLRFRGWLRGWCIDVDLSTRKMVLLS